MVVYFRMSKLDLGMCKRCAPLACRYRVKLIMLTVHEASELQHPVVLLLPAVGIAVGCPILGCFP